MDEPPTVVRCVHQRALMGAIDVGAAPHPERFSSLVRAVNIFRAATPLAGDSEPPRRARNARMWNTSPLSKIPGPRACRCFSGQQWPTILPSPSNRRSSSRRHRADAQAGAGHAWRANPRRRGNGDTLDDRHPTTDRIDLQSLLDWTRCVLRGPGSSAGLHGGDSIDVLSSGNGKKIGRHPPSCTTDVCRNLRRYLASPSSA